MKSIIYIEGGGDSKDLRVACRKGFRKLLESCGFRGNMPRLVASGTRDDAYSDFRTAREKNHAGYIAMLIDSEDPVADIDKTWDHLEKRDGWKKPDDAADDQVLFMTTCMETWIVTDRNTLERHYGSCLQVSVLPPPANLEQRSRHDIQDNLEHATRKCPNAYRKGKRSFEVLGVLNPAVLGKHLPSFKRMRDVLDKKL